MKTKILFVVLILVFLAFCNLFCQKDENLVNIIKKHDDAVYALSFTSDGKYLASGGEDKAIYVWDFQSGELVYSIVNNYFPVRALQFLNDDEILATSGPDVKLIDMAGNIIKAYGGYTTHIWSFDYNPKIRKLIAGSYSKNINIWDFNSGEIVVTLTGHEKSTLPVCFSPDGKYAVTGSLDRSVRLWNVSSGEELKKLDRHSGNVLVVRFHPSGKYFASASLDKTIRLWDVETGKVLKTYSGHDKGILDIEFSPDGYFLASASADFTIVLWEVFTGKKLYSFVDHEGSVNVLRFSPDGNYLVSGSTDKTIMIWKLNKKIFAYYYFQDEIDDVISQSDLFSPKRKGESKQEYEERQQKAEVELSNLYDQYYQEYFKLQKKQNFGE